MIVPTRNARVFVSFKHNRPMRWVANQMKSGLESRFVEVYRLIDDPRTGASFTEQINAGIAWADAVVALWTSTGAASRYVRYEYRRARDTNKPIALVKNRQVEPPPDWNPDERYENMDMINFQSALWVNLFDPQFNPFRVREWQALLGRLADYACRARDGGIPPHVPGGSL